MFVPMILVVLLGFVDCTKSSLAIALLTIGVGMIGCVLGAGFVVSINDIGGNNYSGIIFGISNSLGNIPGIIAPYFVGLMTPHVRHFELFFNIHNTIINPLFLFKGNN